MQPRRRHELQAGALAGGEAPGAAVVELVAVDQQVGRAAVERDVAQQDVIAGLTVKHVRRRRRHNLEIDDIEIGDVGDVQARRMAVPAPLAARKTIGAAADPYRNSR